MPVNILDGRAWITTFRPYPATRPNHQSKPQTVTLDEMRALVGGHVELIASARRDDVPVQVYANEDGKRLHLPINPTATAWVRHNVMSDLGHDLLGIVVVLSGPAVWT